MASVEQRPGGVVEQPFANRIESMSRNREDSKLLKAIGIPALLADGVHKTPALALFVQLPASEFFPQLPTKNGESQTIVIESIVGRIDENGVRIGVAILNHSSIGEFALHMPPGSIRRYPTYDDIFAYFQRRPNALRPLPIDEEGNVLSAKKIESDTEMRAAENIVVLNNIKAAYQMVHIDMRISRLQAA